MTINTVSKTAKLLKHQRKRWERNVTKAHDNGLYALLGDCLDFYNYLDGNPELIEELVAHLKAQDIKGNKGTHVSTLVVRAVFDKEKDMRTFSYAKTLKLAAEEKVDSDSMHKFIVSRGGIESIRRGKDSAEKAAKARVANLSKAKRYFSMSSALGSPITVTNKGSGVNEGRLFVAIMREEADGDYSMVYEADKESLLNSAFTDASKGIPDDVIADLEDSESDQPDATGTTAASDEGSPVADTNVTDGGADTDSASEPEFVDGEMETETPADTKPDEVSADPVTGIGNLRAETLHGNFSSAVRERLSGLAA